MTKFFTAKEALNLSDKNKEKRIEYYLENIENDQKVKKIKRDIEKSNFKWQKRMSYIFFGKIRAMKDAQQS